MKYTHQMNPNPPLLKRNIVLMQRGSVKKHTRSAPLEKKCTGFIMFLAIGKVGIEIFWNLSCIDLTVVSVFRLNHK